MTQARRALSERRMDDAQGILVNLVVAEPANDEAWVLLAETLTDPERKMECLERARRIDPRNPTVQRAIGALKQGIEARAIRKEVGPPEAAVAPKPAPTRSELAVPLLAHAETVAHALIMASEPAQVRSLGLDLVNVVELAMQQDETAARRWCKSAGRDALVKYEHALTTLITNLPHDDAQLATLRAQRQRALDLLK